MQTIDRALVALRDVQGVHGSFVIALGGALIARDLPSAFDQHVFSEVGPRLARLHETFWSGGEEMDSCLLRYAEHKLYLRKMTATLIGVLSGAQVNMPALRMVSNLVIRRIDALAASAANAANAASKIPPAGATPASGVPVPPSPTVGVEARAIASSSAPWHVASSTAHGSRPVIPQDGRAPAQPASDRHVRMYRGRRVD